VKFSAAATFVERSDADWICIGGSSAPGRSL
jgi:hypothetical protein